MRVAGSHVVGYARRIWWTALILVCGAGADPDIDDEPAWSVTPRPGCRGIHPAVPSPSPALVPLPILPAFSVAAADDTRACTASSARNVRTDTGRHLAIAPLQTVPLSRRVRSH